MSSRVNFNRWGSGIERFSLPDYALMQERDFSAIDAVRRAIESRSGLDVFTCRVDCFDADDTVHQLTLGRRLPGGVCSVEGEIWVSIPRGR